MKTIMRVVEKKLVGLLAITFASSVASGYGFSYTVREDGTAVIIGTTGDLPSQLTVPTEIDGHKVVGIGERAFRRSGSLQQVRLPDGLESIGNEAFYYCDNLKAVFIPRSVTSIDSIAFMLCAGLRRIEVDEANAVYGAIEGGLYEKAAKRLVQWPRALEVKELPSIIKIVGGSSMYGCLSLTSLVVPEGVTAVEGGAFQKCYNLETLHLPGTLTSFEPGFTVGKDGGTYRLRDIYFEGSPPVTLGIGDPYWPYLVEKGSPTVHVHRDKGWADVIDRSGSWYGCPVEFIESTNSYSIRFILHDDVVAETLPVICGEVRKLPTLASKGWVRTGCSFRGWRSSANGRLYDDGMLVFDLVKPGETVTMTAVWE